jgi:hypothetical protein
MGTSISMSQAEKQRIEINRKKKSEDKMSSMRDLSVAGKGGSAADLNKEEK